MARQLLIETKMNSLSLQEGVQPKNPHCLGTIKGPCADYENKTRNGNFYSRKLWENVFKDPLVKESLEDNVLIGELDHPGDRLETKATNACIVMTDYSFNDENGTVDGTFDILDTPNGRILKSLLDYGCKMGVSSRGEGDVTEVNGQNNIDENTYYFVAFDAVVLPAVKSAKPSLTESLQRKTLKESLEEQINSAITKSELEFISKVIENLNLPDIDSITESINIKSKELEGATDSSNLMEDLENLTRQLDEVKSENVELKESVNTFKEKLSKAMTTSYNRLNQISEISTQSKELEKSLKEENLKLSDRVADLEKQLNEAVGKYRNANKRTAEVTQKSNHLCRKLSLDLRAARESLEDKDAEIERLTESLNTVSANVDAYKEELNEKTPAYESQISQLNESIAKLQTENKNLKTEKDSLLAKKTAELSNAKTLYESKLKSASDDSKAMSESFQKQISEANLKVESLNSQLAQATDQVKSTAATYSELLREYTTLKAQITGINPEQIMESLKPNSTFKEVNSLVESIVDRQDRYRNFASLPDPVFNDVNTATVVKENAPESQQARSFMETVTKLL